MPTSSRPDGSPDVPAVRVHEIGADRTVFADPDNTDAWISTDIAVEPPR